MREKTGGRQRGTPNRRTQELIDLLEARFPGYHPVVALAEIAHDPDTPIEMQFQAHVQIAPYVCPKRKAVEFEGSIHTRSVVQLTDDELMEIASGGSQDGVAA